MQPAANIAFQAQLSSTLDPQNLSRLADALGLEQHLRKYREQFSRGRQQRVAIARALAVRPKLILADEPTGNLDETTADEVMDQFLALVTETGSAEWWRDFRSPCVAVLAIQEIAMWCRFLERSIVF